MLRGGLKMSLVVLRSRQARAPATARFNLDRSLFEKPSSRRSTARRRARTEEKLFSQHEYEKVKKLRGALYALKPVEAMERLLKSLGEFRSNAEFLETI
jgi:transcription termination factor Rho